MAHLIRTCSYCGKEILPGKMRIFVKGNKVYYFCSRKCEKNWELGRKPQKVKWIRKMNKE